MSKSQSDLEKELKSLKEKVKILTYENKIKELESRLSQSERSVGDDEFDNMLNGFKVYVLLSLFFDVFLIFTILGALRNGKLENIKAKHQISDYLKASHSGWKTFFVLIFLTKIVFLFCYLCSVTTYIY